MGVLTALVEARSRPPAHDDFWYQPAAKPSNSGVRVNSATALQYSAVFACVRVLSETIASLPAFVMERRDGGRRKAVDHPLYRTIHAAPNPEMSAMQYRETVVMHLSLAGNHYAEKVPLRNGRVELWPWNPRRVKVSRDDAGQLLYTLTLPSGEQKKFGRDRVLHIPALAWNGLVGLSPIDLARESIGLGLATEEYGARYFGSGTHPGAVVEMPAGVKTQDVDAHNKLRADLETKHGGLGKAHRLMLLEDGAKLREVGIRPDQSQFLETRKFQQAEIASIFRVPLHMIQGHENSAKQGTGIEQVNLGFVTHTIRPLVVRIESAMSLQLMDVRDQARFFIYHNLGGLLRGDHAARANYYTALLDRGVLNADEVRALEEMNPQGGGQGEVYYVPLNYTPKNAPAAAPVRATSPREQRSRQDGVKRQAAQHEHIPAITKAMARVIRRERNDVMRAAQKMLKKRSAKDFRAWLEKFYKDHETFTRKQVASVFRSLAGSIGILASGEVGKEWAWTEELTGWLDGFVERFAAEHSAFSRAQLLDVMSQAIADGEDPIDALSQRFGEWESGRADGSLPRAGKIAGKQVVTLGQGFTRAVFVGAGVAAMTWAAIGDSCPYCTDLDGRTVGIDASFIAAGSAFQPAAADGPLTPSSNVYNPPAHGGCDCVIIRG